MTAKTGHKPDQERRVQPQQERREQTNLSGRYGNIGIASVAAALHYCNTGKDAANVKPAPVTERRFDLRFIEAAV
jgi:hypothetical protein